jgi:hypothetical protein
MNTTTQKTITINNRKITSSMLRKTCTDEANGGHNISTPHGLEIHWIEIDGEIGVFNAGSVRRNACYGRKVAFLA